MYRSYTVRRGDREYHVEEIEQGDEVTIFRRNPREPFSRMSLPRREVLARIFIPREDFQQN